MVVETKQVVLLEENSELSKKREINAKYMRDWRKKRKKVKEGDSQNGEGDWAEFQGHVKKLALVKGAKSPVMVIYKEMLKIDKQMGKGKVLSGDEIARRNIEAERELREGGYIG